MQTPRCSYNLITRRLKKRFILLVTTLCALSCQRTLGAELPQALKPGDTQSFWCTDRAGAEQVAISFRENASAQSQIKGGLSTADIFRDALLVAAGIVVGVVVDKTLLKSPGP